MKQLLFDFAYDEKGKIVFVENAIRGNNYYCPDCGKEMVFKDSGKSGPGSRRPHFAHKVGGENCTPESVLHKAFKQQTALLLEQYILEQKKLPISWICKDCNQVYEGNLLLLSKSVKMEYDMEICRPDIALFDGNGRPIIAIEIVNTHAPEDYAISFYKEHGIVLVQYNVVQDDIHNIENKLRRPDSVSLCHNERCNSYNKMLFKVLNRGVPPFLVSPLTIYRIILRQPLYRINIPNRSRYYRKKYPL
ncbi:MAG: hypothetical protein J6Z32_04430 [Bacteroidales bacterium]|nr:hypothetical protein [Bacteroidales bacterium]